MEKQFVNDGLAKQAEALKNASCNGFQVVSHPNHVSYIMQLFRGNLMLDSFFYRTYGDAIDDMLLLRDSIGGMEHVPFPVEAAETEGSAGATALPAGAKLGTETPVSIKNLQLQFDIAAFADAKLTAYEIGVTADDKYRLSLYRGSSVAFEYLYGSHEDRSNDMAVVLDQLPKLQHIGGPEFVS